VVNVIQVEVVPVGEGTGVAAGPWDASTDPALVPREDEYFLVEDVEVVAVLS
jgi:hypothetical protein